MANDDDDDVDGESSADDGGQVDEGDGGQVGLLNIGITLSLCALLFCSL